MTTRHDVRLLKAGDKLEDIPLVTCPRCGQTAFTLGSAFKGRGWVTGMESFCHVVEGLTATKGDVVEFCDWKIVVIPHERPFVITGHRVIFAKDVDHWPDAPFAGELAAALAREGRLVLDLSDTRTLLARWIRIIRNLHANGGVTVVGTHKVIRMSAEVVGCAHIFDGDDDLNEKLADAADDVGLDEPLPEDPKLVAIRAEGWVDYTGQTYGAFCGNCNNAAGLMIRGAPTAPEVACKACLVFGHPSFADDPGERYHDNDYTGVIDLKKDSDRLSDHYAEARRRIQAALSVLQRDFHYQADKAFAACDAVEHRILSIAANEVAGLKTKR